MSNGKHITLQPKDESTWLPLKDILEIVNMEKTAFYYHVDKKDGVRSRKGRNNRDKQYNAADAKRLKAKREGLEITYETASETDVVIDWFYASDLPAGLKLVQHLYGANVDLAELVVYQGWWKHNSRITMTAFSHDRTECFASIQVLPLYEQVIMDILSGRRTENSIQPNEIRTYQESGPYDLLVTSVAVLPDRPHLLYELLYTYLQFWIGEMYPQRYIRRVYAQAVSERGDILAQHFFMAPRYDLAYNAYMLDMARPGASKMVKWFQQKLKEKAPLPTELQWPPN
ncbi:MAG: hypothetical protein JO202_00550 [Ktedonobacteraceae bacterium]|nr:hypothetical protein [Ktedonobacteraceae bacterium]